MCNQFIFRQILKRIVDTKEATGEFMREAMFSQAEAKYTNGEFSQDVLQNVQKAHTK